MVEKNAIERISEDAAGYYRQAIALECMGRHSEALAAYACALARDGKSNQLLEALVEGALKSHLKGILQPQFEQLRQIDGVDKAFATVAIIGQELLSTDEKQSAITVLESALQLGTAELSLKGSVCSALSSAYWKIGNVKRALHYMHEDLKIAEDLQDDHGVCRVHGNLGNAHYAESNHQEAIKHYQMQLTLAQKLSDRVQTAQALSAMGHVYVSMADYNNALASHKKCALVQNELNDKSSEAKELGNVGTIYALMGDFENAVKCQKEYLRLANVIDNGDEICKALSNLGGLYQNMRQYPSAITSFKEMFTFAQERSDMLTQCHALSGLGHAFRMQGNSKAAERCHEQQLKIAIDLKDHRMESSAQADLGLNYQQVGDYDKALEYHKANLSTCRKLNDREGEGMAYGHIGNAYHSLGDFKKAVKYHNLGLSMVKELQCLHAEATLHGNIALSFQSLEMLVEARHHYEQHLKIAKELKDRRSTCIAHCNLGNFHTLQENFTDAASHYEKFLSTAEKLHDSYEKSRASYKLAYTYYCLERYDESIQYYEMSIGLSSHINDTDSIALAYCNLGLAYSSIEEYHKALRCQKFFLATSREKKNIANICKALGNLGSIYLKMGDIEEGFGQYHEQIKIAEDSKNEYLIADCYYELAKILFIEHRYDDATLRFEKELDIRRQLNDFPGHYRSLLTYAEMLEQIGKLKEAYKCYCEMSQLTRTHKDLKKFQHVCHLMGNINMKMERFEKAIASFRLQLKSMNEPIGDPLDVGLINVRISDCYAKLSDFENAIVHLLEYQKVSKAVGSSDDENKAYKKLSEIYELQQKYKEALMYSEKRLGCIPELSVHDVCSTYTDVAVLHAKLGNLDSAITYYDELYNISRNEDMLEFMYEAHKGLGTTYNLTGNHEKSLAAFNNAIDVCNQLNDLHRKAECCVSAASQQCIMGKHSEALLLYENALSIVEETDSRALKVIVCGCLGKVYQSIGNPSKAKHFFSDAVSLSQKLKDTKEKIKAHYRLGLLFYQTKQYEMARKNFQHITDLTEQDKQPSVNYLDLDIINFVTSSYQMLQKVLSLLQKPLEALFVAEKNNCINLEGLLRKTGIRAHVRIPTFKKFVRRLQDVNRIIQFYSIVTDELFCWLIIPGKGFETFWEKSVTEDENEREVGHIDFDDIVIRKYSRAKERLGDYVKVLRESLSVEPFASTLCIEGDPCASSIEMIGRKENIKSQIGLPVVMMNRVMTSPQSPSYQFRYTRHPKRENEFRPVRNSWYEDAPLDVLYDILLVNTDEYLAGKREELEAFGIDTSMSIVIPQELSLVTFGLLRGGSYDEYFSERYNLSFSPSLFWLLDQKNEMTEEKKKNDMTMENILVFGTNDEESAQEAIDIARIFGCSAVLGNTYPKYDIIDRLSNSTVCHLSTDVVWRSPSLAFPYNDLTKVFTREDFSDPDIENLDDRNRVMSPVSSDVFLSVKDISELQLNSKLATVGIAPSGENTDAICPEGLHLLVTALLMSGCKTVMTSLWPIARNARRFFLRNFYYLFNRGVRAHKAFTDSIRLMQTSEDFKHPCNWSGIVMYGQNGKLTRTLYSFHDALYDFLTNPNRDIIKVILHLVEKARQRLSQEKSALYVAEESIVKKMQWDIDGWRGLLVSLGFRFEKAHNDLPDSIFFPSHEYMNLLNSGSNTLYAFLGLNKNGLDAIAQLRSTKNIGKPLIKLLQEVLFYFNQDMSNVQVPFPLPLWRISGCHEFLSALGFDVMGIGKEEVMLRSGKNNMRRNVQCAIQAIKDLFEIEDDTSDAVSPTINKQRVQPITKMEKRASSLRSQSESNLHKKFNENHGADIDKVKRKLLFEGEINNNDSKDYLTSQVGLFGSKQSESFSKNDRPGMLWHSRSTMNLSNVVPKSCRFKDGIQDDTVSVTSYGIKPDHRIDLKRYGTMEKLNVNDLVVMETPIELDESMAEDWDVSLGFHPDTNDKSSELTSPNISLIPENGMTGKKIYGDEISMLSGVMSDKDYMFSQKSSEKQVPLHPTKKSSTPVHGDGDGFTENYLLPNHSLIRAESVLSIDNLRTFSSNESAEDSFSDNEISKVKPPAEWSRLQLDKSYFEDNSPIKTSNIRDSLIIGSSPEMVPLYDLETHFDGISLQDKHTDLNGNENDDMCDVFLADHNNRDEHGIDRKKRNWLNFFHRKKSNPGSSSSSDSTMAPDRISLDSHLDPHVSCSAIVSQPPHMTNNTRMPHMANDTRMPHMANDTRMPHMANDTRMPHMANDTRMPHMANDTRMPPLVSHTTDAQIWCVTTVMTRTVDAHDARVSQISSSTDASSSIVSCLPGIENNYGDSKQITTNNNGDSKQMFTSNNGDSKQILTNNNGDSKHILTNNNGDSKQILTTNNNKHMNCVRDVNDNELQNDINYELTAGVQRIYHF